MKRELAVYLRLQAAIAAAFNFFIGGMILYIALKSLFSSMLGAFATCAVLYAGMCRAG